MEELPKDGFTVRIPSGWLFCGQELMYNVTYSHLDHSDAFRVRVYYPDETVLGSFWKVKSSWIHCASMPILLLGKISFPNPRDGNSKDLANTWRHSP